MQRSVALYLCIELPETHANTQYNKCNLVLYMHCTGLYLLIKPAAPDANTQYNKRSLILHCTMQYLLIEPAAAAKPGSDDGKDDARRREVVDGLAGPTHRTHAWHQRPRHGLWLLAHKVEGLLRFGGNAAAQGNSQSEETAPEHRGGSHMTSR